MAHQTKPWCLYKRRSLYSNITFGNSCYRSLFSWTIIIFKVIQKSFLVFVSEGVEWIISVVCRKYRKNYFREKIFQNSSFRLNFKTASSTKYLYVLYQGSTSSISKLSGRVPPRVIEMSSYKYQARPLATLWLAILLLRAIRLRNWFKDTFYLTGLCLLTAMDVFRRSITKALRTQT